MYRYRYQKKRIYSVFRKYLQCQSYCICSIACHQYLYSTCSLHNKCCGTSILKSKFNIISHITYTQFNTYHNTEPIPFYIISLSFSSQNVSGSSGCKAIIPQSRTSKKKLKINIFVLTVRKHLNMKILK